MVYGGRTALAARIVAGMVLWMTVNVGCFSERSFRLDPSDSVALPESGLPEDGCSTREWLRRAHAQLAPLLPPGPRPPLLTEEIGDGEGRAVDVFAHFGIDRSSLQSILRNLRGITYSAQAASRDYYIHRQAPPWPGFEDIWIPVRLAIDRELYCSGRIGYARDARGEIIDADCIVILPGLFGDHGVKRSADLAIPLRESGCHVLHLELRGHGQTEARCPDVTHTFGVIEPDDLMQVADWLQSQPHIRRTGLIGYCWNANIVLLAAWYENRLPDDPAIPPALRPYYVCPVEPEKRRFEAGVIAFSPVVRWEVLMDELDRPRNRLVHPVYAAIQDTVRDRMEFKGWPSPSGNLRLLVSHESDHYRLPLPRGAAEGYPVLRLLPYKDQPATDKLGRARMPVLIVHGADDPLVPAQDAADLIASVSNRKVAGLILPTGGHVGFAAYAPRYYLSLIRNFFDPRTGPAACAAQAREPAARSERGGPR